MRFILTCVALFCVVMVGSCASKQLESKISTLETENQVLTHKLKEKTQELATLEEEVTFLKGRNQTSAKPVSLASSSQKRVVKIEPAKKDSFFEEDIAAEETLVFTNKDIEKIAWGQPSKSPAKVAKKDSVSKPKKEYQEAYSVFQKKDYNRARVLMLGFIDHYPHHEYTDNAHFWTGETYYAQDKFQEADVYYKNVIRDFSKGNKVPDAMYRAASCAMNLNKKGIAKQSLEILIQKYPTTVAAAKAKKTLQTLK